MGGRVKDQQDEEPETLGPGRFRESLARSKCKARVLLQKEAYVGDSLALKLKI